MALGHWFKNFTKWYFNPETDDSGGGGGSSDFSTAEVTLVATVKEGTTGAIGTINVETPCIVEGHIYTRTKLGIGTTTLVVVTYGDDGTPLLFADGIDTYIDEAPVATGDITFDEEDECFVIKGDGTISIVLTN